MIAPRRQVGQRRLFYCIVFLAAFAALRQMLRLGCGSATLTKEFISSSHEATEAESWRARAHEREGGVQVGAVGIATLGEDGAAAYKPQTH